MTGTKVKLLSENTLDIFFSVKTEEEKREFIKTIKEIVNSKIQCRVVFVIREEFLAGITEFEYDIPEIFSNRFRVEKMKRANAILAVDGPCKVNNISTEEGFSEETYCGGGCSGHCVKRWS